MCSYCDRNRLHSFSRMLLDYQRIVCRYVLQLQYVNFMRSNLSLEISCQLIKGVSIWQAKSYYR